MDLPNVDMNTLHLNMKEEILDDETTRSSINVAALFIQAALFRNPIWDVGLQHGILRKNEDRLYTNQLEIVRCTVKCLCPCSTIFKSWHAQNHFDLLPKFSSYGKEIFIDPPSFVTHLYRNHNDYYH